MSETPTEIRTLLAPVSGGQVILPGSVVAEVVSYQSPVQNAGAPVWLLGGINWNNWNIQVVSFAMLAGLSKKEVPGTRTRILIVKSLSESTRVPYFGILISGVPRLAKVSDNTLTEPKKLSDFPCVFREVTIDGEQALIPDMDELTRHIKAEID
jgi:chemosensory pili system protein ChpC